MHNRGVSPVIGVIVVAALVVILGAGVAAYALGFTDTIEDERALVVDTTGEFDISDDTPSNTQIVTIKHKAGDSVRVADLRMIVRALGPDSDFPKTATLTSLPASGASIDGQNIIGNDGLIDKSSDAANLVANDDRDTWRPGDKIKFRVNTGTADFRIPSENTDPKADTLEVRLVYLPTDSVLSEHAFP